MDENTTNIKKDITLKELQKAIKKIDGVTDGDSKMSDRYFMKFIEEVGELSECIRKDKRMVDNNIKGTIEEELYDVLYYIICLANVYHIDLQNSIFLKEKLNAEKYNRKSIYEDFKVE
jgi:NTP pyrophosphatase (non-canonical NTP hydrolase)